VLISQDLLRSLQSHIRPAQLCVYRIIGSDNEYVLRVRFGDVHLDYPLWVEGLTHMPQDSDWSKVTEALVVMSKMVVPPGIDTRTATWNGFGGNLGSPEPVILSPMGKSEIYFGY